MDMETLTAVARLIVQVGGVLVAAVFSIIGLIGGMFLFFNRLSRERVAALEKANKEAHDGIVQRVGEVREDVREVRSDVKEILKRLPPTAS